MLLEFTNVLESGNEQQHVSVADDGVLLMIGVLAHAEHLERCQLFHFQEGEHHASFQIHRPA